MCESESETASESGSERERGTEGETERVRECESERVREREREREREKHRKREREREREKKEWIKTERKQDREREKETWRGGGVGQLSERARRTAKATDMLPRSRISSDPVVPADSLVALCCSFVHRLQAAHQLCRQNAVKGVTCRVAVGTSCTGFRTCPAIQRIESRCKEPLSR